jgi:hypothetical protein
VLILILLPHAFSRNAGLSNTTFIAGRAEDALAAAIAQHAQQGKRVVAIVDPPREGIHPKVIQALRKCKGLDTLVYISCNHGSLQSSPPAPPRTPPHPPAPPPHPPPLTLCASCLDRKHRSAVLTQLSQVPWNGARCPRVRVIVTSHLEP